MHELSIALSILDIAAEESASRGGADVVAIHIRLGRLSGVVKEALVSAYELARESSPFTESRLVFEDVPVMVYCKNCEAERPVKSIQMMACQQCNTPATEVISGRDMEITAMEIEERPSADRTPLLQSET